MEKKKFILPEGAFRPLDEEEAELMAASASGILEISKTSEADKIFFEAAAKNSLKRKKIVSIRLDPDDIAAMKEIAQKEGTPYQTLISSVIHKYRSGRLVSR